MSETAAMPSSRSSRTPSFTSERSPSLAGSVTFPMPTTTVRPAPAYIAASVASQTVTDHHNAQLSDSDHDHDELANAVFSDQALSLLNGFLDHLLLAFLSSAKSPSLTAIRPAISDVLKPHLAREAMEAADEELQGLLAGEDDDEFPAQDGKTIETWDVEKVWKRTRLRIMVYTRLGELEDEDEERYVQQERGLSMDDDDDEAGLVSWASAIFLTSVIEYVAEQLLLVSGSAAFGRLESRNKKTAEKADTPEDPAAIERLTVEEPDVEKIALNAVLGCLWRTWRKRMRSPLSPLSPKQRMRSASSYSSLPMRKSSRETINTVHSEHELLPEHQPTETDIAANIPLPMGGNDVDEIEVPGLAPTYEDEDEGLQTPVAHPQRSASVLRPTSVDLLRNRRKARPLSLPMRPTPVLAVPRRGEADEDEESAQTSDESDKNDKQLPSEQDSNDDLNDMKADDSMMAFTATTGMGLRMGTPEPRDDKQTDKPGGLNGVGDTSPKVMSSRRISIDRSGPPGLVRTFSTRSSTRSGSLKSPLHTPLHTPAMTPKAATYSDGKSSPDDNLSEDESEQSKAIGIARRADNAIRTPSTTPDEPPRRQGKRSFGGGYVEVQPQSSTPISLSHRETPSPDYKSTVSERLLIRNEIARKPIPSGDVTSSPSQYESPTGAPWRQEGSRSVSLGSSLPALQEVETSTAQPPIKKSASVRTAKSNSPASDRPTRHSVSAGQDGSMQVPDRRLHRISTGESIRSQPSEKSPSDSTSLKRGASTSSSLRKQSVYPISSGRESVSSYRSRGLSGRMSEEDRAREFDSLVKGQDTVKFTLTPQNMRDLDVSRSCFFFLASNANSAQDTPPQTSVQTRSSSTSSGTAYPRVSAEDKSPSTANLPSTTAPKPKPSTAQHRPSASRKVVTRPLARDPKVETESMRDFADFIRSTGPSPGQEKPVQPFVNINAHNPKSNVSTSSLARKLSTRRSSTSNGAAAKTRLNMEPRSPAGLSTGNGDLIDFIRQGPPDANNGQPRIPRSVAPFRTTVDSDQFETMLGGHANVETAYGSASSTLDSKDSSHTINSRTGLISSPGIVQPAYSNMPQQLSGNMSASNEPQITRTRHRVKDPYAIDFSDEDDDEDSDQLTALPSSGSQAPSSRSAAPKQESFMDFLNAMEPPSTHEPQPFMLSEETIAAARARAHSNAASTSRNLNATALSSTTVSSDAPRAYKPRIQARAPAYGDARGGPVGGAGRTGTSDLADFLKNSGPPEPPVRTPAPPVKEEKKSRKFWRR